MTNRILGIKKLAIGIKKDTDLITPVNDLNLYVNKAEILGVTGVSGCGKTLTALSIAGLLPENAKIIQGRIKYNGKLSPKNISMIFQETRQALNPLMKVGRQITETLELSGYTFRNIKNEIKQDLKSIIHWSKIWKIPKIVNDIIKDNEEEINSCIITKERMEYSAMEMLESLGFKDPEKVFNSYPHELSGGMCQRVLAAIALIKKPLFLIADEPSSALDEESQNYILSLIKKLNKENRMTVLIISHDLSIIKKFCTRYLVMNEGKIIEEGLPEETPKTQDKKVSVSSESQTLLSIKNVSNKYILKNINLEIKEGEIFGLVGNSGCGKTTLARAICGLINYEGGILLSNQKPRRPEIQMIFQEPGASLNPRKRIGWLLEEPLVIHKIGNAQERRKKIDKMLLRVGLDSSYKTRFPHELSGGQKQRVSIARALILEPRILIADEPISSLDVHAARQILKLFKIFNRALGLTILFISHNKEAVEYLCGRAAVMDNGEVAFKKHDNHGRSALD